MKKSSPLIVFFIFIFTISGIIIGAYLFSNFVLLPKFIIPKICEAVNTSLQQKLTIRSITITPKGLVSISGPILYAKDSQSELAQCKNIVIFPNYKKAFESWKKNKNAPEIHFKIDINELKIQQAPIKITGQMPADFHIKFDLKHKENTTWGGTLSLKNIKISGLPALGDIEDINGNIAIMQNSVGSSDIQGKINGQVAKLEFLLDDFKQPELELRGELSPLKFSLSCAQEEENINIKDIAASYNQIQLNGRGTIADFKTSPFIACSANASLTLEDLNKLPFDIKPIIEQLKPAGLINADIEIKGPLQDVTQLQGNTNLTSTKVSLLNYVIENIQLNLQLKEGKINLENLQALFLGSEISSTADLNLKGKNLPYNARIRIANSDLKSIKETFAPQLTQELNGILDSDIYVLGQALDLNSIDIQASATLSDLSFDKYAFPYPLELNADLLVKNIKNIIIKKLLLEDKITTLQVQGNINNLNMPEADITAKLKLGLDKLNAYKFLNLPSNLTLSGTPDVDLQIKGIITDPGKLSVPFKIQTGKISANQFSLEQASLEGVFKNMSLDVASLLVKLYNGELAGKALVDLKDPQNIEFSLNSSISGFDIQAFAQGTKLIPPGFEGILSSQMSINGSGITPSDLQAKAQISFDLEDGKVNGINIEKANAALNAQYANLSLIINELAVIYKTIELNAKGKIDSVLADPTINITASSQFKAEDLNKLPFDFKKTLDMLGLQGKVGAQVEAQGPLSLWTKMQINAALASPELSVKNIRLENIDVKVDLHESLANLTALLNTYGGNIDLKAKVNLLADEFTYSGTADIKEVNIGTLIEESKIIPQPHKGIFSLSAEFKGAGMNLNTIESQVSADLEQAEISGLEILHSMGKLLNLDFLSNFEVTKAHGTFAIQNSNVHTEDTTLIGPDADITARGNVGFDQKLDLITRLTLSKEAQQQTNPQVLDKFFTFENDQFYTELDIKGTLTQPKPDLSKFIRDKMQNQVKKEIKKQVFKTLEGLFK